MTVARTPEAQIDSPSLLLGELRGQLRELVHGVNNMTMKVDALAQQVSGLASLPDAVVETKAAVAALSARVAQLERERDERRGATSIVGTIMKSPAFGWLVGAAVSAWAILTGKVHV